MTYETIILDISDNIATITLNRPDRLNAASLEMADEINQALHNLGGARALVITGAGRAFCSGADLQARGILAKQGTARGGPGVRYSAGPRFPVANSPRTTSRSDEDRRLPGLF